MSPLTTSLLLLLLTAAPLAAARVLPSDYWLSKRASLTEAIWGYGASLPTRAKPDSVSPTNVTGVTEIAWDLGSPGRGAPSLTSRVYQVLRQQSDGQDVSSAVRAPRRAKKAFLLHRKRFTARAHGEQNELYNAACTNPHTHAASRPRAMSRSRLAPRAFGLVMFVLFLTSTSSHLRLRCRPLPSLPFSCPSLPSLPDGHSKAPEKGGTWFDHYNMSGFLGDMADADVSLRRIPFAFICPHPTCARSTGSSHDMYQLITRSFATPHRHLRVLIFLSTPLSPRLLRRSSSFRCRCSDVTPFPGSRRATRGLNSTRRRGTRRK